MSLKGDNKKMMVARPPGLSSLTNEKMAKVFQEKANICHSHWPRDRGARKILFSY